MTQEQFEQKWYLKLVKPTGYYQIPDKEYFVTGCLLEENGAKFAIMATDYSRENKHYITFDLAQDEIEKLDSRFQIIGDYSNIESESTQEVLKSELVNGEWQTTLKVHRFSKYVPEGEETDFEHVLNSFDQMEVGRKSYLFLFRSTTGEPKHLAFDCENRRHETNEELFENMSQVRNWINIGMYHFFDRPFFA